MNMTDQAIEAEFIRQVFLCSGIGPARMIAVIERHFGAVRVPERELDLIRKLVSELSDRHRPDPKLHDSRFCGACQAIREAETCLTRRVEGLK